MQLFLSLVFVGLVTASRPQMAGESVTYLVGRSLGGLVKREA
ncbi:hypothetical protein H9L39_17297 [Fusarium oxysporum f. sp. albedinis]|nr:hypothetical protein H9L39_17297 [Fusarium oxysporum f. sp. albedinis]